MDADDSEEEEEREDRGALYRKGRMTWKALPSFSFDSMSISPPISSVNLRLSARPNPAPSCRVSATVSRWNSSNTAERWEEVMPLPRIQHSEVDVEAIAGVSFSGLIGRGVV